MQFHNSSTNRRGMTLIEVLIAVAVLLLMFGGLISAFQTVLKLVGSAKAQAGAVSLANERMEYIRSLSYDSVGTVNGIPAGVIPELATTSLNGITYNERILVEYVDDPKDGIGAADTNGIVADYKLVKVQYSWTDASGAKTISLISNIIPKGIETTTGGGTLVVNVFDATALPVSGAAVHLYNNSGTTTINTTRYTNTSGVAMFSGAPARANYQITATNPGYSTDQTYSASSSNPNPITPHIAVVLNRVSTMNFQIDRLSSLRVMTIGPATTGKFEDLFTGTSSVATSANVSVSGGEVKLAGSSGSYAPSGTLFSTAITPGALTSWDTLLAQTNTPALTSARIRIYDRTGTTTPVLIPDSVLPGNSVGFTSGSLILSSLSTSTYRSIALGVTLQSSNVATTSKLFDWSVTYTVSEPPIVNTPFTITGAKKIGTTAALAPVYKYLKSYNTGGTGSISIPNLEWDIYSVDVTNASYDVAQACSNKPYKLAPNTNGTLKLTLVPNATYTLLVSVVTTSGAVIPNATLQLHRTALSQTKTSSVCGQAFFNSALPSATDYDLDVHASGFIDQTINNISISGDDVLKVTLVGS